MQLSRGQKRKISEYQTYLENNRASVAGYTCGWDAHGLREYNHAGRTILHARNILELRQQVRGDEPGVLSISSVITIRKGGIQPRLRRNGADERAVAGSSISIADDASISLVKGKPCGVEIHFASSTGSVTVSICVRRLMKDRLRSEISIKSNPPVRVHASWGRKHHR